jgi:AraC-like DNA-binding protein
MSFGRVLSFTDPFPYQAAIRAADVELYPTKRGKFRSELTQVNLNQLWLQRFHEMLPRIYAVKMKAGRRVIGFLTDENQPAMRHCSMDVSPRDIMVCGSDAMHQRSEAGSQYGSMSLPTDDLDAACRALVGREFAAPPFTYLIRPDPALMSRLLELHKTAGKIAKATPNLFELPEVVRNLQQQMTHLMVRCLMAGVSVQMKAGAFRHDQIVVQFEEFLEANPDQPLYLTEICAAIGVAERTLRAACEEHLGMGPIRYLSLRRMHLVRRALLSVDSSTATVTRIATDHGFWELGRFSGAYRTLFGESPSETLRRPSDDSRIFLNRWSSLGPG